MFFAIVYKYFIFNREKIWGIKFYFSKKRLKILLYLCDFNYYKRNSQRDQISIKNYEIYIWYYKIAKYVFFPHNKYIINYYYNLISYYYLKYVCGIVILYKNSK